MWRIEVAYKPDIEDVIGLSVKKEVYDDLGIELDLVRVIDVYTINKDITRKQAEEAATKLFADPITQTYSLDGILPEFNKTGHLIEVSYKPGVTDNVAVSAIEGLQDLLNIRFSKNDAVYTGKLYAIVGELSEAQIAKVVRGYLANDVVEEHLYAKTHEELRSLVEDKYLRFVFSEAAQEINAIDMEVDDAELQRISEQGTLSLDIAEMQKIRDYFRNKKVISRREGIGLGSAPTDGELEMLAQTWSEHCKHKIFNSLIEFTRDKKTVKIDSLFKTYIKGATDKISRKKRWLVSVFVDNAGIIELNDTHNLVFKVETHNHPSALDPYGGAITGIVGVNRDPMGTGIGAELLFNTDVFCFGPPDFDYDDLTEGILHPKRVFRGVRRGVEHGGNKIGIPTVNGAILFDEAYIYNPLVYCGTGGIMPKEVCRAKSHEKQIFPGDLIIMVGGRVGKDGIHGATFSSTKLEEAIHSSVVQIGAPIVQKKMMDALLEARDLCLYRAITDNGAGGLSSSVGEMATLSGGARVELEKVPVKYPGLQPWELWVSEAQERMTAAVSPEYAEEFLKLMDSRDVEATVIGNFTDDGFINVTYKNRPLINLDIDFLHAGLPRTEKIAQWKEPDTSEGQAEPQTDHTDSLLGILGSNNVCSKEWVIRQYDHEVQGKSVIKPLVGKHLDGPSDAAVLKPLYDQPDGVIISNGINPMYGTIDPYAMAVSAIDEAVRNIVAVGGDPDRIALLDNFCWGNPIWSGDNLDGDVKLGALVRAAQGCYDAAIGFEAPFISGKDSFHNEYKLADKTISIPPTLLISAIGVVKDAGWAVTMDAKKPGDLVYILGLTKKEMGGSHYFKIRNIAGGRVPRVDFSQALKHYQLLHEAIKANLVSSCHDCSEGGLAVAAAETAFAGDLGMRIELDKVQAVDVIRDEHIMFSESNSRLIITIDPAQKERFENAMKGAVLARIGEVTAVPDFIAIGNNGEKVIDVSINKLKEAWKAPLRW